MCAAAAYSGKSNTATDSLKAVIYARYSSHNQNDASIEQQVREIKDYARHNGIKIIQVYEDRAVTGKKDKRQGFQKMMRDAEKGKFQLVITYDVARFARNRFDAAMYKGRLKKLGIRVVYKNVDIPDTPEGILLESILEGQAEYYSASLARDVKRGMKQNALECKSNNGAKLLGYRVGASRHYELDPETAPIVKEMFELYNTGIGSKKLCDILNSKGLRTQRGNPFNIEAVRRILTNRRYLGIYIWGDIEVEGGMPQIIQQDLFDSVQEKVKKMKMRPAANRSVVDFKLTGKLYCGHCGDPMAGSSGTSRSGEIHYYYACNAQRKHRCKKKPVKKDWIEEIIVRTTVQWILQPGVIERLADGVIALQEREKKDSIIEGLQIQLRAVTRSIDNVMNAIEQGIITATTKKRLVDLEKEKADLENGIEYELAARPSLTRDQIIFWLERFRGGDAKDDAYQDTIIDTFINKVFWYDDHFKIVFNYSGEPNIIEYDLVNNIEETSDIQVCQGFEFERISSTMQCFASKRSGTAGAFFAQSTAPKQRVLHDVARMLQAK